MNQQMSSSHLEDLPGWRFCHGSACALCKNLQRWLSLLPSRKFGICRGRAGYIAYVPGIVVRLPLCHWSSVDIYYPAPPTIISQRLNGSFPRKPESFPSSRGILHSFSFPPPEGPKARTSVKVGRKSTPPPVLKKPKWSKITDLNPTTKAIRCPGGFFWRIEVLGKEQNAGTLI